MHSKLEKKSRLPKQWSHWAKKARLRSERKRGIDCWFYMIGRGRRFMVNCYGNFKCSCPIIYFDRWANSFGAEMEGIPLTEAEFLKSVRYLINASKDTK